MIDLMFCFQAACTFSNYIVPNIAGCLKRLIAYQTRKISISS
ncbi:hypothetical protein HMPREF0476_1002 [Kingella kingae ATCC 23330]|uniref:Uncharacterized protein n=1 Tax=Kingella kingae ATCC 23330 TaxID=887327 RepID=F5S719_KINKI|nr:hypothetical protein HMPREF0476_1002 [Kingella kingae ATCC 23330]